MKLTKKLITALILPNLSVGKRGPKCKVGLWRIVRAIFYRLKTGCQWRMLPMKELFGRHSINWESVYYYFNKWCADGSWERLQLSVLDNSREELDMSSVSLDGSHTIAKKGGEAVAYQGRKKARTTNILFLTDKRGLPLIQGRPVAGNHNDLHEVEKTVRGMLERLIDANICVSGLFLNADAGFDSSGFRSLLESFDIHANIDRNKRGGKDPDLNDHYFDSQLYTERFAVERTNAWFDGMKSLIMRYEVKSDNWSAMNAIGAVSILIRKLGIKEQKL